MQRPFRYYILFVPLYALLGAFLLFMYFMKLGESFSSSMDKFFAGAPNYGFQTFVERAEVLSNDLLSMNRLVVIICLVLVVLGMSHILQIRHLGRAASQTSKQDSG